MIYLFRTLIIITILSSCSTYIKSPNKINNEVSKEHVTNSIEGFYNNNSEYSTLWNHISTKKSKYNNAINRKSEIVEVIQISPKMIKLRLLDNKLLRDSLYIKGSFKDDGFEFKTRKYIEDIFPLFWTYSKEKKSIKLDSSNNLVLTSSGWSINFLIIAPIMAADGNQKIAFKRQ